MNKSEFLEPNIAIAKYENRQLPNGSISDYKIVPESISIKFRYHCDWNWLMPVIEKIELSFWKITIETHPLGHLCTIERENECQSLIRSLHPSKIIAVWLAVEKFVTLKPNQPVS